MSIEPQDPIRVLHRLHNRLRKDIPNLQKLEKFYKGDFPPPWTPDKDVDAEFRALLERAKLNYMRPIVDSRVERMKVKGFRLSADTEAADPQMWKIWEANRLGAESKKAFKEALVKGRCYLSVWYPGPDHEFPQIAIEDATQVYVEHEPGTHRRVAAIKVWDDDTTGVEVTYANVYLPNVIYKYVWQDIEDVTGTRGEWVERAEVVEHELGIPLVPLLNNPDLTNEGESEIADVLASQERINEMVFNRSLAGWFAAHRQKHAAGIDIPRDPETGEPLREYLEELNRRLMVGKIAVAESENAKFGTFDATDPNKYTEIIEAEKQSIGEQKKLPRHYFLKEGSSVNGQSIKAAEAGLVAVVKDKMDVFGEAIEEALVLSRKVLGEETSVDAEVVWASPEHRTEGELTDSVVKQHQEGLISRQTALEILGFSPQEIARELVRFEQERTDPFEALNRQLAKDMGDV